MSNYKGYLLAAHPKYPEDNFKKSVILILSHDDTGIIGLQINKPFQSGATFATVMHSAGLSSANIDQPLYMGGTESTNRVYVIHSLDWYSPSTVKLTKEIGVSTDLSVLMALSQNEGPEYFRAVAGFNAWETDEVEGSGLNPEPWDELHSWPAVKANINLIFESDTDDQWNQVIKQASQEQINSWF